ncbi:MAG: hypothetical protein EOO41_00740 [Methanobacteriota archaeon]|nr:MAG: hypothetical protein EOO41_00740 [Euryarchaeota archaeon]
MLAVPPALDEACAPRWPLPCAPWLALSWSCSCCCCALATLEAAAAFATAAAERAAAAAAAAMPLPCLLPRLLDAFVEFVLPMDAATVADEAASAVVWDCAITVRASGNSAAPPELPVLVASAWLPLVVLPPDALTDCVPAPAVRRRAANVLLAPRPPGTVASGTSMVGELEPAPALALEATRCTPSVLTTLDALSTRDAAAADVGAGAGAPAIHDARTDDSLSDAEAVGLGSAPFCRRRVRGETMEAPTRAAYSARLMVTACGIHRGSSKGTSTGGMASGTIRISRFRMSRTTKSRGSAESRHMFAASYAMKLVGRKCTSGYAFAKRRTM